MIYKSQDIKESSWLNKPEFEWFCKGYGYASTQTLAIEALSQVSPEALYYAVCAIMRGAHIRSPEDPEPTVAEKTDEFLDWLETRSRSEREEINGAITGVMCRYCGGHDGCQCWNDE